MTAVHGGRAVSLCNNMALDKHMSKTQCKSSKLSRRSEQAMHCKSSFKK
jgi:hypothetical protein